MKFSSGNEMTATDVQFSFDRLRNLKDNPAELASNIASVAVIDPRTVKIVMVDKSQPLLNLLVGPSFVISDSKVVQEHGGTSAADADKTDTANKWLDHHSAGTGPYVLSQWEPNAPDRARPQRRLLAGEGRASSASSSSIFRRAPPSS